MNDKEAKEIERSRLNHRLTEIEWAVEKVLGENKFGEIEHAVLTLDDCAYALYAVLTDDDPASEDFYERANDFLHKGWEEMKFRLLARE